MLPKMMKNTNNEHLPLPNNEWNEDNDNCSMEGNFFYMNVIGYFNKRINHVYICISF